MWTKWLFLKKKKDKENKTHYSPFHGTVLFDLWIATVPAVNNVMESINYSPQQFLFTPLLDVKENSIMNLS